MKNNALLLVILALLVGVQIYFAVDFFPAVHRADEPSFQALFDKVASADSNQNVHFELSFGQTTVQRGKNLATATLITDGLIIIAFAILFTNSRRENQH